MEFDPFHFSVLSVDAIDFGHVTSHDQRSSLSGRGHKVTYNYTALDVVMKSDMPTHKKELEQMTRTDLI